VLYSLPSTPLIGMAPTRPSGIGAGWPGAVAGRPEPEVALGEGISIPAFPGNQPVGGPQVVMAISRGAFNAVPSPPVRCPRPVEGRTCETWIRPGISTKRSGEGGIFFLATPFRQVPGPGHDEGYVLVPPGSSPKACGSAPLAMPWDSGNSSRFHCRWTGPGGRCQLLR
jgi:hypothetical protein